MLYITKSTSRLPVTQSSSLGRYDAKNMITAHVTIPGGIRRILPDAFSGQVKIRTIVFPESLRVIMPRAFSSCTKLQELTLPSPNVQHFIPFGFRHLLTSLDMAFFRITASCSMWNLLPEADCRKFRKRHFTTGRC